MAPSGHRRNLQPKSSAEIFIRNLHPCRTGDSLYNIGRTKHCSVRYKNANARTSHCMQKGGLGAG